MIFKKNYLTLLLPFLILGVYVGRKTKPKNVRNNNPLNIKTSAEWTGESALNLDKEFEEFTGPNYGFRAGYIILLQYLERGTNSIESIIETWAPSNTDEKNHTANYAAFVADKMGVSVQDYVTVDMLPYMMLNMSIFEGSGGVFTIDQVLDGIALANKEDFVTARLLRLGAVLV
jgi:hypothetical protein